MHLLGGIVNPDEPCARSRTPLSTQAKRGINRLLEPLGFELMTTRAKSAESSRLAELQRRGHWATPRYSGGLSFEDERYLHLFADTCVPYQAALGALPQVLGEARGGYYVSNSYFSGLDAAMLYGMVRRRRPTHIIECGSGYSTRLMRAAISDGALPTRLTAIDPEPRVEIGGCANSWLRVPIEQVEISTFVDTLSEDDILFIDSSHAVVTGGDVPYLCLEVLPQVKKGALIHFHDIFLPFDYPEEWVVEQRWGWSEQYLVHGFLAYNQAFEILWPARYMWEYHRQELEGTVPMAADGTRTSLWLRKAR